MQTKEFLQQVWPDQGYYCVLGKDQQNVVVPKFINSIDEAIEVVNKLLSDKQDVYFLHVQLMLNPLNERK